MEFALPVVALGYLYVIANQNQNKRDINGISTEGFSSPSSANSPDRERMRLPNTDIPNKNYPDSTITASLAYDKTSELSNVNTYKNEYTYSDKYFDQAKNSVQSSQLYSSLTGGMVPMDHFKHDNMVPFHGSADRTSYSSSAFENVLDAYTGAGSQTITKSEQSPLFQPNENYQWAYGAPSTTDFIQSRVNGSMNMAGVKPFQDVKVGPGLGLGYTTEGQGGFNSGMVNRELYREKTVDELRVATNQKASEIGILGYEGAPKHFITQPGEMGVMEKNRPDRHFEMGQDRYFTTTGIEKRPPMPTEFIDRPGNRNDTATEYGGIATSSNPAIYVPGEYMPAHTQQLGPVPLATAVAYNKNGAHEGDYSVNSNVAYPNNRTMNDPNAGGDNYFGIVGTGGIIGAMIAPIMDFLRPTRKENTIGNLRVYETPGTKVPNSYIYNPADRPAPTIRETTENSKGHSFINSTQRGDGYTVANPIAPNTYRQTQHREYEGIATSYAQAQRNYDAEYAQRNNDLKSSTLAGYTPGGYTNVLNNQVNPTVLRNDNYRNTRDVASDRGPILPVGVDSYGQIAGTMPYSNNGMNIQMERNTPEILDAFRSNPFTHSISI